jgi:hypothetical protein
MGDFHHPSATIFKHSFFSISSASKNHYKYKDLRSRIKTGKTVFFEDSLSGAKTEIIFKLFSLTTSFDINNLQQNIATEAANSPHIQAISSNFFTESARS